MYALYDSAREHGASDARTAEAASELPISFGATCCTCHCVRCSRNVAERGYEVGFSDRMSECVCPMPEDTAVEVTRPPRGQRRPRVSGDAALDERAKEIEAKYSHMLNLMQQELTRAQQEKTDLVTLLGETQSSYLETKSKMVSEAKAQSAALAQKEAQINLLARENTALNAQVLALKASRDWDVDYEEASRRQLEKVKKESEAAKQALAALQVSKDAQIVALTGELDEAKVSNAALQEQLEVISVAKITDIEAYRARSFQSELLEFAKYQQEREGLVQSQEELMQSQAQLTHKLRMAQEETRRLREVVEAQQAPRTPECLSTHPLHPEPDSHVSIVLHVVDADEECEKLVEKLERATARAELATSILSRAEETQEQMTDELDALRAERDRLIEAQEDLEDELEDIELERDSLRTQVQQLAQALGVDEDDTESEKDFTDFLDNESEMDEACPTQPEPRPASETVTKPPNTDLLGAVREISYLGSLSATAFALPRHMI